MLLDFKSSKTLVLHLYSLVLFLLVHFDHRSDDAVTTTSFSPICRGFTFTSHDSILEEEQEWITFYTEPCLNLYWTDCCVSCTVLLYEML